MKLKDIVYGMLIVFFSLFVALIINCNTHDGKTAYVTIDTGINTTKNTRDAAPADITGITLVVSGSSMGTITETIPTSTGRLTLSVPIGDARTFTVTASAGNFTYSGSTTQDITESDFNDISIAMVKQAATLSIDMPDQAEYAGTVQEFQISISISETSSSIQETISPAGTLNIEVPPGSNRQVTLTAVPLAASAVISFSTETTTADFTNGQTTTVSLSPVITEMKLVLPDSSNGRIIQIDSITTAAATWTEVVNSDIGLVGTVITPYDIDFDKYGRIYFARNSFGTNEGRIYRIDSLADSSADPVYTAGFDGVQTLSIDRSVTPNVIYFSENSGNQLNTCTIDSCTSPTILTISTLSNIRGIEYYNGILLVAHGLGNYSPYNLTTEAVINTITIPQISGSQAWDMIVKNGIIYASFYDTGGGPEIHQFSLDGSNNLVDSGSSYTMSLFGPHRFINNLTDRIYFNDENNSSDQLVVIDDISGTGRDQYGANGASGVGIFDFFL
jgi:hypothetical protein